MNRADAVSRYVSAPDGLGLHFRDHGSRFAETLPVVCLPGLARTAADFESLAAALVQDGRRVLALDYRGRGLSARDPDPRNYDLRIESADVLAVLTAAEVSEAVFIGTSRGGLITMILAALRPALIAGAVLNDIGPVIESKGLERIRGYVGKLPQPRSWAEAVDIIKGMAGSHFTGLAEADWMTFARLTFKQENGAFLPVYDPMLMENLKAMDLAAIPTLWSQFDALAPAPVLVIRGANSDLLSMATVGEMTRRHPDCALHTVEGQGHAPLLTDAPTIARIAAFVAHCEAERHAPTAPVQAR